MDIEFETKRDHEELTVEIKGKFCIEYEGSMDWLNQLREFIEKKSI